MKTMAKIAVTACACAVLAVLVAAGLIRAPACASLVPQPLWTAAERLFQPITQEHEAEMEYWVLWAVSFAVLVAGPLLVAAFRPNKAAPGDGHDGGVHKVVAARPGGRS
jgi:hypothetical protein